MAGAVVASSPRRSETQVCGFAFHGYVSDVIGNGGNVTFMTIESVHPQQLQTRTPNVLSVVTSGSVRLPLKVGALLALKSRLRLVRHRECGLHFIRLPIPGSTHCRIGNLNCWLGRHLSPTAALRRTGALTFARTPALHRGPSGARTIGWPPTFCCVGAA
jgi:hypothetical protein